MHSKKFFTSHVDDDFNDEKAMRKMSDTFVHSVMQIFKRRSSVTIKGSFFVIGSPWMRQWYSLSRIKWQKALFHGDDYSTHLINQILLGDQSRAV